MYIVQIHRRRGQFYKCLLHRHTGGVVSSIDVHCTDRQEAWSVFNKCILYRYTWGVVLIYKYILYRYTKGVVSFINIYFTDTQKTWSVFINVYCSLFPANERRRYKVPPSRIESALYLVAPPSTESMPSIEQTIQDKYFERVNIFMVWNCSSIS